MAELAVGVIGTGGMGLRHVVNLQHYVKGVRLTALYDLDSARAEQAAAACAGARLFRDPQRLIDDPAVDAIIIASPDATHADFVLACLRQGKPVLCEKPLATSAEAALQIVEAEQSGGRQLVAVGFMRRFDPQHAAVRQVVQSGEIGRPLLYKGVHRNMMIQPDVPAEAILTNSASHDIDAIRWLLGQEIDEVYVRGVRSRPSFSERTLDLLLLQMAVDARCLATVELFVAAEYGYEVSAEIVAERGTAVTAPPEQVQVRSRQTRSTAVPADWLARFQEAYVAELRQWVHSVREQQPFEGASAWDGYLTLLVTDACIQSLRSGRPVQVLRPARPDLYRR